jgi:hypothetical protein
MAAYHRAKLAMPNRLLIAGFVMGAALSIGQALTKDSSAAPSMASRTPTPVETPTPPETLATGEPQPIARLETIVVNQIQVPTVDIIRARITRVSGRTIEAAATSVNLYAGDEIETDASTYVTITFLEGELERENQIIIYPETKLTVGSGWTWFGRALYRVRGWFEGGSDSVAGGSGGTEYLLTVCKENKPVWCQDKDGKQVGSGTDLAVLDDSVSALTYQVIVGDPAEAPANVARTITISSPSTQCRAPHVYALQPPENMPWLEFLPRSAPLKIRRGFGRSRLGRARFIPKLANRPDRPNPAPGEYQGKVKIKCLDCTESVPVCEFNESMPNATIPIIVKVATQSNVEKHYGIDVREVKPDATSKRKIEKGEASVLVDSTSDVILSTQPLTAAPFVLPNYSDVERKAAFKNARSAALVDDRDEGYLELGKVNLDWGKGAKALQALEKVSDNSKEKQTAEFAANVAEGYRLTNQLEKAQDQVDVAKTRMKPSDPAAARVLTTQGNIYQDQARQAIKRYEQSNDAGQLTIFEHYIGEAQRSYIRASEFGGSLRPMAKAVPHRNLGDAYALEMDTLVTRNAIAADVANENALKAYGNALVLNPEDKDSRKGQGYAFLKKARLMASASERTSLGQSASLGQPARDNFVRAINQQAKDNFVKAINADPKDSEALAGRSLANAELGEKTQASIDMQSAVRQRKPPDVWVEVPNLTGKSKVAATQQMIKLKLEPVFVGAGFVVIEQKPLKGTKVRPGTKITLRVQ